MAVVIKIQVAENTDQIIKDYFMTSTVQDVTQEDAKELYDAAVQAGIDCGTDMFDTAINIVLEALELSAHTLAELTKK